MYTMLCYLLVIATVVIIIKLRYDATLESGSEVLARDSKAFSVILNSFSTVSYYYLVFDRKGWSMQAIA